MQRPCKGVWQCCGLCRRGWQNQRLVHLEGTSTGVMLTLGKDEIIIRMAQ